MVACLNAGRVVKNMRATRARVNDFFIFLVFSWGDNTLCWQFPQNCANLLRFLQRNDKKAHGIFEGEWLWMQDPAGGIAADVAGDDATGGRYAGFGAWKRWGR